MKPAHPSTLAAHARTLDELDFSDRQDFDDAQRGFIDTLPDAHIEADAGGVSWSMRPYGFLKGKSPDTVNPSLWRMSQLNAIHGLFKVSERVYQVRGFSLANVTFVEGDQVVIVVDPLQFTEHARAALALYRKHRGERPVTAVIYPHSHRDHYGGVRGVIGPEDVKNGVEVIAPFGFTEESFSESILAGVPMRRRALFQFGWSLAPGEMAHVDSGLGKNLPRGRPGLIAPTREIAEPLETLVIDGLTMEFQLAPDTEAPAEMHLFIPSEGALNLAENATHTLHNLCPLRGAKVRDALAWSKYLNEALHHWAAATQVILGQHHWPTWGNERALRLLAEQRDLYRYLHDQTVRLMNHGLKAAEIAERLQLPPGLAGRWHARGYYGSVSHNVKAIYQHYLSWYDAHPASLNRLPPVDAARKYVAYMGGADALLARAHEDYARGEFRWVAEVMAHLVYAEPANQAARGLAAAALEQLGFQAESATWRNAYLRGAHEYRAGPPQPQAGAGAGMLSALSNDLLFDLLAVRIVAPRAAKMAFTMAWHFSDSDEHWLSALSNNALSSIRVPQAPKADAGVRTDRATLDALLQQQLKVPAALASGRMKLSGNSGLLAQFFGLLDRFDGAFPVVDAASVAQ